MADFTVMVTDPNGLYMLPDARLTLHPVRWRAQAVGGPYTARVEVSGPRDALESLKRHLGHTVTISSELGEALWYGIVHEIELWDGDQTVTLSLDGVINRAAVAYTVVLPDGSEERRTTIWAEDARSVGLYGKRERMLSSQTTSESAAAALRAATLARYAAPLPAFSVADSDAGTGAMLYCRGMFEQLEHIYYQDLRGLEENAESRRGEIALGAHYTATTISFGAQDDVMDSANGLLDFIDGAKFTVSGAASAENNGAFTVAELKTGGALEVSSKDIVDEAAGATVTLARDSDRTTHIAQSFVAASGPWSARKVALRVRREGSPSDDLRVRLWPNAAGAPDTSGGVPLAEGVVAAGAVPTDEGWVEFTLDALVTLAAGVTYWLVVTRMGAPDFGDYYVVGIDENLSYGAGVMRVYRDGSYVARATEDADLIFRITGLADTGQQIEDILTASNVFSGVDMEAGTTGLETWQYREGDRSCAAELEELLALGTSASARLLVDVTLEGRARVRVKPTESTLDPTLLSDGHVGGVDPGQMIAGRWAGVGNPLIASVLGENAIFVEESEYDTASGKLSVEAEAGPNALAGRL